MQGANYIRRGSKKNHDVRALPSLLCLVPMCVVFFSEKAIWLEGNDKT